MTFEFTQTEDGFRIHDTIENAWSDVAIGRPADPDVASTERFRAPLDVAVTVEAATIRLSPTANFIARHPDGTFVDQGVFDHPIDLPSDTYELEVAISPFKLYIAIEDTAVTISNDADGAQIVLDHETTVTFGLRSFYQRPAGTVTSSSDPTDLMQAVSTFGSALQTHSPERSFPTLRGHPPELAIRGRPSTPADLEPPETGVKIEVPPSYDAIFTVAPLAFYLGATVEPGPDPGVVAAGTTHAFDPDTLATDVAALLKHCLLLDCVVRTVGLYPTDLYELGRLAERTTIDRDALYELQLDERTARYLDIPLSATTDLMTWPAVADIDPIPLNAEALPYLSYRLAAIRAPAAGTRRTPDPDPDPGSVDDPPPDMRGFLPGDTTTHPDLVDPAPFDARQHLWVADGTPAGGAKPTLGSYLRSTDATASTDGLDVHVVCGPEDDPSDLRENYRTYSAVDRTVTVHPTPTTNELRSLLQDDVDFLHFRGATTSDGLECLDGALEVLTLPEMNADCFLLEDAASFQPALALIHTGGIAGAVTMGAGTEPSDPGAVLAELLDFGFSIAAATDVLERVSGDDEYVVLGDGDHQIRKASSLTALFEGRPDQATADTVSVECTAFTNLAEGVGAPFEIAGDLFDGLRLLGDHEVTFDRAGVKSLIEHGEEPLLVDGDLYWLDELSPQAAWDLLR